MIGKQLIWKFCLLGTLVPLVASCSLEEINYVVLDVAVEGEGSGSVVESRFGGIDCAPDCQQAYPVGAELILKADSLLGSKFQGWGGACSGTRECKLTMDQNQQVTAKFGLPDHRLTVRLGSTGTGTVTSNPPGIICGYDCAEDYPAGRFVALTASAAKDSVFTGWGGVCSGTDECRVELDGDRVVIANFDRVFHELSVEVNNPDYGKVTSFPVGIDCGSDCDFTYVSGTAVRLRPEPVSGSVFLGWEGACGGTDDCQLTMTSSKSVRARFARNYRVSVSKTGTRGGTIISAPGGISCGSVCENEFAIGATVNLTALPDPGARFVQWSGDCSGSGACELLMDEDHQVSAEFTTQYAGVDVVLQGVGDGRVTSAPAGIDCGTDCNEQYPINSQITLTASAASGSEFRGWIGTVCAGTRSTCVFSLTSTVSIYANFGREYPLDVSLTGTGGGRVTSDLGVIDCGTTCQDSYEAGTSVRLTAVPESGSRFISWSGDCSGSTQCSVTLDAARSVTANFERIMIPVVIEKVGVGYGTISDTGGTFDCGPTCAAEVAFGTQLSFVANAGPGSKITQWLGACRGLSTCTVTVEKPTVVGVSFGSEFQLIRADSDQLGSPVTEGGHQVDEAPQRTVTVSRNYWMKGTEVTRREWNQLMAVDPSGNPTCGFDCPVNNVSYEQVVEYLNRASAREGLERCYKSSASGWIAKGPVCAGYRLPTEAEWEFAARAGSDTAFYNGDITLVSDVCATDVALDFSGWHCGNSSNSLKTVGQKLPNAAQLFDMSGNVWEMVQDSYAADSYSLTAAAVTDPTGPATSTTTPSVIRGGAFDSYPRQCRSAAREQLGNVAPTSVGFRPVRSNLMRVSAGSFQMGSLSTELGHGQAEGPVREITLTRALYVNATEITQGEWSAVLPTESNPSNLSACGAGCPVEQVSYFDTIRYMNARTAAENRDPCYIDNAGTWTLTSTSCSGYRLPTEAEWEYLARAGTLTSHFNGEGSNSVCAEPLLDSTAWYCGNANGTTHPVGMKTANAFGLYDVYGNVAEWTEDNYSANYYSVGPQLDPVGPATGASKTIRGGNWAGFASVARSAARADFAPSNVNATVGFRTVRNACPATNVEAVSGVTDERLRRNETMLWTGEEVIVFGGSDVLSSTSAVVQSDTGYAYRFEDGTWRSLPRANAPLNLTGASSIWTGEHVLTWGGKTADTIFASNGRKYDPLTNEWSFISNTGQLSNRLDVASAWTGMQWVIWGGWDGLNSLNDGARYLPGSDQWLPIAASSLVGRFGMAALWLGNKMLIVGGRYGAQLGANDYALYDPANDSWSSANYAGGCSGYMDGAKTDRYVVVRSETGWCRYDILNDQWLTVSSFPDGRLLPGAQESSLVTNGGEILVFGTDPLTGNGVVDAYNPTNDTWRQTINQPAWSNQLDVDSVWTGCGIFSWTRTLTGAFSWLATP